MTKKSEPSIEEQYKKLTQYEHILSRPDTYVGSLEFQKERLWVFNSKENKLEFREVSYVPGLFKIFDEILVNAADNYQRDKSMKYIKVDINPEENRIKIKNGGKGIPIEIHKTYNMYVPQLIFGNLLTSSNYNDNVKKVTGGRNGYGAKLTNIFSKTFIVETANKDKGKKYKQKFYNNMLKFDSPEIKDYSGDDFTCITFEPDLSRFGMEKMDEDIISLFKKRVYDMAGITPKGVSVYLNGEKLQVENFEKYINMYIQATKEEDLEDPPIVFEQPHERWEIAMSLSESQFQQVSFVNSISTYKGGTHVNYVTDKIVKAILEKLEKKNKQFTIKPQHVRQHLWIFVNSQIENPTFDSQTKETLTSKPSDFGSSFELSENFIKKVFKTNIVER
jgi:DNA topoisomerase-2